jgi:hypothetical protein
MRVRDSARDGEELARPRPARPGGPGSLLGLQAAAGNRAVAAALGGSATTTTATVAAPLPVQRCGDHVSPGCACAEEATDVQRDDEAPDADTHEPHLLEGTSCTPYASWQAPIAFARMKAQLLPAVLAATGSWTNVQIWNRYLGDGGTMAYSDTANPGDPLVESVRTHENQVPNAVNSILDHIEHDLTSLAPQHLKGKDTAELDLATLVPPAMLKPNLEWVSAGNPAANVIGQIGSSDVYGRDKRSISGTVRLIKQHRPGDRLTVDVRADVTLKIHVEDTADFCPGNIGPVWEQNFTIPLSRLEASGWAHDVHVVVDLTEANRSTGLVNLRDPDVEG